MLTAAIGAVFAVTYWLGTSALTATIDSAITEQLELLSARPPELLQFMIASRMNHQPGVVTRVGLFDAEDRPIVGDIVDVPPGVRWDGRVHPFVQVNAADEKPENLHLAGQRLRDGRLLIVGRDMTEFFVIRGTLLRILLIGCLAAAGISVLAGIMVGVRAERRLRALRRTARRIHDGAMQERLPRSRRGDELDQLSSIMNLILDRLEDSVLAWKSVGQDIAHDIRTPLTSVRARLERALEDGSARGADTAVLERAISGIDDALGLAAALLRLAEIERALQHEAFGYFDLTKLVEEVGEAFLPVAEDRGVRLSVRTIKNASVFGDRELILEAVFNLVDNAIKFTGAGHHVVLQITGSPERPIVCVADDGPGIPAHERERVFWRFHRVERSRSSPGSGLGLALVAAIARVHDFAIELSDNHPGCLFELRCWPSGGQKGIVSAEKQARVSNPG